MMATIVDFNDPRFVWSNDVMIPLAETLMKQDKDVHKLGFFKTMKEGVMEEFKLFLKEYNKVNINCTFEVIQTAAVMEPNGNIEILGPVMDDDIEGMDGICVRLQVKHRFTVEEAIKKTGKFAEELDAFIASGKMDAHIVLPGCPFSAFNSTWEKLPLDETLIIDRNKMLASKGERLVHYRLSMEQDSNSHQMCYLHRCCIPGCDHHYVDTSCARQPSDELNIKTILPSLQALVRETSGQQPLVASETSGQNPLVARKNSGRQPCKYYLGCYQNFTSDNEYGFEFCTKPMSSVFYQMYEEKDMSTIDENSLTAVWLIA